MLTDMESPEPRKKSSIVLDSAALIAGTDSLYALGGLIDGETQKRLQAPDADHQVTFYTTPDVIREIRDQRARARLALLQDVIVVRPPSSEVVATTISFAKATGDYPVLSLTDLRVIALCRMLEIERDGGSCLRSEPAPTSCSQIRVGTLIPLKELEKLEREAELEEMEIQREHERNGGWTTVQPKDLRPSKNKDNDGNSEKKKKRKRKRKKKQPKQDETESAFTMEDLSNSLNADVGEPGQEGSEHVEVSSDRDSSQNVIEDGGAKEGQKKSDVQKNVTEDGFEEVDIIVDDDDDNEEDWITVDNVEETLAHDAKVVAPTEEEEERVGCVTTDFAMQNTMLQMGLKILTVDGRRAIRKIKHFALRCSACGLVTRELGTKFCDACGNFGLHRVAFRVSKDGVARAFLNPKKTPNIRGTKYPIPQTKGGRNNNDLVLRADQIDATKQRRIQKRLERENVDVLDPTTFYNAGARFNPNEKPVVIGYGRRNPNEVRKTSGKK